MYMDDIKKFAINEKGSEIIQSGYWDRILHRKICRANNEKRKTPNDGKNRTITSQEKIRILGENETYECLGILKVETI